jgi:ribosome-binding protein aMBF1 (putative translation factor)
VDDAMTQVLEARKAFDATRAEAKAMVDRARAELGLSMIQAREQGGESQSTIAAKMGIGPQQVRDYEAAYRAWVREHKGESLTS